MCVLLFRGRSRKVHEASDSTDAQKKFGDAKSISSDQYFGGGRDPDVSAPSCLRQSHTPNTTVGYPRRSSFVLPDSLYG